MKKIFLLASLSGLFFSLCAGQFPYGSSFGKDHPSWNKNWSASGKVLETITGGITSGVKGKDLRLTLYKMIPVKKGDVVQLRVFFRGKSVSCGILGYDSKGKSFRYYSGTVKEIPGTAESNGSLYFTVPEGVASVRAFVNVKENCAVQGAFVKIIPPAQQETYFYKKTPSELSVAFHSGNGRELPRNFGNMWNSGKVEVLAEKFSSYTKTLRITSDKKDSGVRFEVPFPVKKGDCVLLQTVFKGSGYARIGVFGSGLFKAKVIPTVNRQWDKREEIFEITSDKCKNLYFFLAGQKGHSMTYAYVRLVKLENDPRISFLPERLARKWKELTAGTNLSKGKTVTVYPARKKSTAFLTDGKISLMTNLVFHSGALVWQGAMTEKQVRLIVDLGSVQKVGKAGIRISGGKSIMQFPRMLKIFVSKDGKKYYPAVSLAKVTPAEADLSDFQNLYYLPDKELNGVTFTYPFVLNVNADARYVAFAVDADSYYSLVTDELAVVALSGKKSDSWNQAYTQTPDPHFCHEAVRIRPFTEKFYIAEDIFLPNLLSFEMRLPKNKEKFTYTIDLPSAVEFSPYKGWPPKSINLVKITEKNGRKVFHFAPDYPLERMRKFNAMYYNGPFLFRVPVGKSVPAKDLYAVITAKSSGGDIALRYPLEILKFGKVPSYKRLKLGMMIHSRFLPDWPEFVRTWKVVGYNMFQYEVSPHQISDAMGKRIIEETDRYGIYRRAFASPVCDMCYGSHRNQKELRCTSAVLPGKKWMGQLDFCPSYRGEYYKTLLENIRKMVVTFKPHVIEFDDEAWNPKQLNFIPDCTRCSALRKEKNMKLAPFIEWAQADFLKGYYHAVKKGAEEAKIPMPDITHWPFNPVSGNYSCRGEKVMNHGFPYLFPKYANLATYFYYAQSVADQQKGIRKVLETVKDPKRLAITVHGGIGCYRTGYMGKKTKHLFVDSILNGTTHVLQYGTFASPHDYYQMNEAIRLLVPYEAILMDGALDLTFSGSNKNLLYTKRTLGKRSLLLIGNYGSSREGVTTLRIRGKVLDCIRGKTFSANGSCNLVVPPDDFALLLVTE